MYPQPKSSITVLNNQEYFRLFTELQSNGDIYEIDTSAKGLVIGPNSDVQNVRVYYFDEQAPYNKVNSALVSVSDPWIGRINALMDRNYPDPESRARILVTSEDLIPDIDQTWTSIGNPQVEFNPIDLAVVNRPYIDLLCYHSTPPALPIARAERKWVYAPIINDRGDTSGISWYLFPHYRRKYFSMRVGSLAAIANPPYIEVYGITVLPRGDGHPTLEGAIVAELRVGASQGDVTSWVLYGDYMLSWVDNGASPPTYVANTPAGYYDYMLVQFICLPGEQLLDGTETSMTVLSTDWAP